MQALAAFEVLLRGLEGAEDPSAEPLPPPPVPETLREWFSDAKLAVNRLSPAMLSLLRRFLALKVGESQSVSPFNPTISRQVDKSACTLHSTTRPGTF